VVLRGFRLGGIGRDWDWWRHPGVNWESKKSDKPEAQVIGWGAFALKRALELGSSKGWQRVPHTDLLFNILGVLSTQRFVLYSHFAT
jgi:hypothetical protein